MPEVDEIPGRGVLPQLALDEVGAARTALAGTAEDLLAILAG